MRLRCVTGPFLFLAMFLMGCQLKPQYAISDTAVATTSCSVLSESSRAYSELNTGPTLKGVVVALGLTSDGQKLWMAYSREPAEKGGQVFQVRLPDWQVLNAFEVDSLSARFTRFSGDGKLIASFKPVECPSKSIGFCAEPKVWNTTTGDLISIPRYPTANLEDIDFDKQGRWLMTVGGNLEVFDPTHAFTGSSFGIVSEEPENIVAGTFNGVGNLIAYGTEQGSVGVEGWDGQTFKFAYELNLGVSHSDQPGKSRIDVRPTKLALSPSHKWLAVRFDEGVELLDISSGFFPRQAKVSLPRASAGALEFDPSGSLLAVGYSQGMRVYSVPDLRLVLDKPGPQTTAMAFSPDGCLLAWGDEQGTVHIISIPKP